MGIRNLIQYTFKIILKLILVMKARLRKYQFSIKRTQIFVKLSILIHIIYLATNHNSNTNFEIVRHIKSLFCIKDVFHLLFKFN